MGLQSWASKWSRRGFRVWLLHGLAALMLLMQQAGLRHGIEHERRDDGAAAHSVCAVCLAFQATDHTAAPPTVGLADNVGAVHVRRAITGQAQCATAIATGFQPRAPPIGVLA
jgi:hypothetical protein